MNGNFWYNVYLSLHIVMLYHMYIFVLNDPPRDAVRISVLTDNRIIQGYKIYKILWCLYNPGNMSLQSAMSSLSYLVVFEGTDLGLELLEDFVLLTQSAQLNLQGEPESFVRSGGRGGSIATVQDSCFYYNMSCICVAINQLK